jgi:hypothetical protein
MLVSRNFSSPVRGGVPDLRITPQAPATMAALPSWPGCIPSHTPHAERSAPPHTAIVHVFFERSVPTLAAAVGQGREASSLAPLDFVWFVPPRRSPITSPFSNRTVYSTPALAPAPSARASQPFSESCRDILRRRACHAGGQHPFRNRSTQSTLARTVAGQLG